MLKFLHCNETVHAVISSLGRPALMALGRRNNAIVVDKELRRVVFKMVREGKL
jgi:hypothetical protein